MLSKEIYENALRLLAQSTNENENEDLAERAPYIIAQFCTEALYIDTALRRSLGEEDTPDFHKVWLSLDDTFPLLDRMAPIASMYLAAMLVLDEDKELSDTLYDKYCDAISSICSSICSVSEKIADKYFGYD